MHGNNKPRIKVSTVTKILFIDNDETAFEVRQCMAKVIAALPPVELFHANDATEGLAMLENLKPDVVILDNELQEERDLFLDSLTANHPPIVIQTETPAPKGSNKRYTYIPKSSSLEGIHQTLVVAANVATKTVSGGTKSLRTDVH